MRTQKQPMNYNQGLRLAAAAALHTKRGDDQLARVTLADVSTLDDARTVIYALLVLIRYLLSNTSQSHAERVLGGWISAISRDEADGNESVA